LSINAACVVPSVPPSHCRLCLPAAAEGASRAARWAHDQNRQLMRFVTMSLVSYAGAAIVMLQAVDRLIGADRYSCMCLENLYGGLGTEFDAFEGVHIIPRCDHLLGPPPGTGDHIQPVTLRPRTGVALPRGVLCPSYPAPPPILTPAIFCFYHHHSRRWGRDADPQPNPSQRRPALPPFPHSLFVTHSACCWSVRTDCAPQHSLPVLFLGRVFVPMRTIAAPAERQATAPSR